MRRWFIVALLVSLCHGSLVAALTPAAASQTAPPKILRIWWGELPESLEPQQTDFGQRQVVDLAYEGLTRLDEELTPVPGAAESWQFSEDGLTLTFHLRDGLVYSDGSPLTAERFRYAVERQCDPHNDFRDVVTLFVIVGCEALNQSLTSPDGDETLYETAKANLGVRALDERTLEIQLTRRVPSFLAIASGSGFRPVKQEIVEAEGPDWWRDPANWVGNGPFNVASLNLDAEIPRVGLARNVRYWGGPAKLDGIEYAVMDFEAAWDAYLNGDLDILPLVSDAMSRIENDPVLSRQLMTVRATYAGVFLLNLTREPFQDKKVREAFAYAFDRQAYCREVEFGTCTPTFSWIPPGVPGSIETDAYAFDPERARRALAESKYGGPENLPEITWYVIDGDDWGATQAQWLADQFHSVLDVELLLTPITEDEADAMLWVDSETWPQIGSFFWYSDLPDPSGWLDFWLCDSDAFAIFIGYCNPEFDALYARADSELDPERRIELFEEAGHMLVADAPSIFVYNPTSAWLVKPYVTGYSRSAPQQQWPGWWAPLQVDLTQPT